MGTIYEMDYSLYNETDVAGSFTSHQETSLSSMTTTGKPEDDPMMGSIFKEFSESYNQINKNWGEPASEEVTKVVSVALRKIFQKLHLNTSWLRSHNQKTVNLLRQNLWALLFLLLCLLQ